MTILVFDSWAGSGDVNGKVPTSGGGTWQVTSGGVIYFGSNANSDGIGYGDAYHSASYTDVRITANINPDTSNAGDTPITFRARANLATDTRYEVTFHYNYFTVQKIISGAYTDLSGTSGYPAGISFFLPNAAFQVVGSNIRVIVAGTVIYETTDTSISGPGQVGFTTSWSDNGDYGSASRVYALTIETPFLDVTPPIPGRNVSVGQPSTIGIGYLGSADIALMASAVVAALNATTIPVNVESINNADVLGTGTAVDKWRGVGV